MHVRLETCAGAAPAPARSGVAGGKYTAGPRLVLGTQRGACSRAGIFKIGGQHRPGEGRGGDYPVEEQLDVAHLDRGLGFRRPLVVLRRQRLDRGDRLLRLGGLLRSMATAKCPRAVSAPSRCTAAKAATVEGSAAASRKLVMPCARKACRAFSAAWWFIAGVKAGISASTGS